MTTSSATAEPTQTITEKLKTLVAQTEAWRKELEKTATEQQSAAKETTALMEQVTKAMQDSIEVAKLLTGQVESVGAAAARMRAEWQPTSGAATNTMQLMSGLNQNPFAAQDYISGASMLTTDQKAEFLRIVKDRDESGLNTLLAEYKVKIDEIYNDEYRSIKDKRDALDQQQQTLAQKIQEELASIKGQEQSANYQNMIALIKQQRQEASRLSDSSALLTRRLGQYDQEALRLEGQVSILKKAWDDRSMQSTLASGARGTESEGYSKGEVQWLINQALETGAGAKFDQVALTELLKKIDSAVPTKRYQLDLTVGDQKLSAFTDLSPEKFIEALLRARGTAI